MHRKHTGLGSCHPVTFVAVRCLPQDMTLPAMTAAAHGPAYPGQPRPPAGEPPHTSSQLARRSSTLAGSSHSEPLFMLPSSISRVTADSPLLTGAHSLRAPSGTSSRVTDSPHLTGAQSLRTPRRSALAMDHRGHRVTVDQIGALAAATSRRPANITDGSAIGGGGSGSSSGLIKPATPHGSGLRSTKSLGSPLVPSLKLHHLHHTSMMSSLSHHHGVVGGTTASSKAPAAAARCSGSPRSSSLLAVHYCDDSAGAAGTTDATVLSPLGPGAFGVITGSSDDALAAHYYGGFTDAANAVAEAETSSPFWSVTSTVEGPSGGTESSMEPQSLSQTLIHNLLKVRFETPTSKEVLHLSAHHSGVVSDVTGIVHPLGLWLVGFVSAMMRALLFHI